MQPLNRRLSRTLQLGLKRPQQKSYPHINGLYLLLRATGLGRFDPTAASPRLQLDTNLLVSWAGLSPTEQYLTLLETWLLRGRLEIIGEDRGSFWSTMPLTGWASLYNKIPAVGLVIGPENKRVEESLRYQPGLTNLALLELFGLVRIKDGPPLPGAGWHIQQIERTLTGEAWLACLLQLMTDQFDELAAYDDPSEIRFGIWQPALRPWFPNWRRTLTFPEPEFQEGLFILKVSLGREEMWRRLAVPAQLSLDELAGAILTAINFDFDHLYRFTYANRFGAIKTVECPDISEYPEEPLTTSVRLGDLPLQVGQTMTFTYDFCDWWKFEIRLEEIRPADPRPRQVELLARHGASPRQYDWYTDDDDFEEAGSG
ncbi:MAG: hypothetical protein Kow0031_39470 [Anaerolineae bacterium]